MIRFAIGNAFLSLRRNLKRNLLVGLAIAIGAAAITVHGSLVAGIHSQMLNRLVISRFGHVSISPVAESSSGSTALPLIEDPASLMAVIRKATPDAHLVPSLSMPGMAFGDGTSTSRVAMWGVDSDWEELLG